MGFMMAGCVFWEGAGVDLEPFPDCKHKAYMLLLVQIRALSYFFSKIL